MILMGAAEYASVIETRLEENSCNRDVEVFSLVSHENRFVDFLFECFAPRPHPDDYAVGRGYKGQPANWLEISIDTPVFAGLIEDLSGRPLERPKPVLVNHWGFYTRPGMMNFYRHLLRDRDLWTKALIAQALNTSQPQRAPEGVVTEAQPGWL